MKYNNFMGLLMRLLNDSIQKCMNSDHVCFIEQCTNICHVPHKVSKHLETALGPGGYQCIKQSVSDILIQREI